MARYKCSICGYVHDDATEGVAWSELPGDWTCPVCGATKDQFQRDESAAVATAASAAGVAGEPEPATESATGPGAGSATRAAGSSAGRVTQVHRIFGYLFIALYLVLLVQMFPRLWAYQIEFPPRTVLHIGLGMGVGVLLLLKVAIVRFFRRLDQPLVPLLGTWILTGSVVLIGISAPFAFQEALTRGSLFADANRQRVETLLTQTGLQPAESARLASPAALRAGQRVLRQQCTECHDLRTVLARPRTPTHWRDTVRRMADRTTASNPLEPEQQWEVTAYLVALSPQLLRSTQLLRDEQQRQGQRERPPDTAAANNNTTTAAVAYDPAAARQLFERKCSQCHETTLVSDSPPHSAPAAEKLVAAMIEEGLEVTAEERDQIVRYLTETYAQPAE